MKNTNTSNHIKTKNKFTIVIATFTTVLLTILSSNSIVQATELVKVEPVKNISLYQEAKESLALSFTGFTISQNDNDGTLKTMIVNKESSTNINATVTLVKGNIISD